MALAATPGLVLGGAPRVNLLPRAETDRRARAKLLRRWVWVVVAALAVVLLAAAAAFYLQLTAAMRNVLANDRTNSLLSDFATLTPVREKIALEKELAIYRAQAMGTDLEWSALLATAARALPDGVTVVGFSLAPGGLPQAETDPQLEVGATGSLTLSSESPADIVELIRDLRPIDGVLYVDGWELTAEEGVYLYVLRIDYDQSAYTGAYALEEADQ